MLVGPVAVAVLVPVAVSTPAVLVVAEPAVTGNRIPPRGAAHHPQREFGVDRVRPLGREIPARHQRRLERGRVPVKDGARDRPLRVHALGVDVAQQAVVEERDPAVGAQQVVAGVGIAERDPVPVGEPEVKAVDDLAVPVALALGGLAYGLESLARDVLGGEDPAGRERGVNARDEDERMASPQSLDPALVLSLELVVELLADPLA